MAKAKSTRGERERYFAQIVRDNPDITAKKANERVKAKYGIGIRKTDYLALYRRLKKIPKKPHKRFVVFKAMGYKKAGYGIPPDNFYSSVVLRKTRWNVVLPLTTLLKRLDRKLIELYGMRMSDFENWEYSYKICEWNDQKGQYERLGAKIERKGHRGGSYF